MGILSLIKSKISGIKREYNDYADVGHAASGRGYNEGELYADRFKQVPEFGRAPEDPIQDSPNQFDNSRKDLGLNDIDSDFGLGNRQPVNDSGPHQRPFIDEHRGIENIENQLQIIRSQVETINERLKNIEIRLGNNRY